MENKKIVKEGKGTKPVVKQPITVNTTSAKPKPKKTQKVNSTMLIAGAVVVVLIIVLVVFLLTGNGKSDKESKKDENENNGPTVTDKDIETAYGMSKQDAIDIVKPHFNSDNFSFAAELNANNKYTVTVTNTLTDSVYKYEVDPLNKTYYEIDE